MPGLHLYCDLEGGLGRRGDLALRAAESLVREPWFKLKTLLSSRGIFLGATYHAAYPVVTFENDEFFICLEGRIYGMSESAIDSRLAELATSLYPGGAPCITRQLGRIASWVTGMDGDFVIVVQHRPSGHITLLNDALGRLPLFIHHDGSRLMATRELRFITSMFGAGPSGGLPSTERSPAGGTFDFDRTSLAHYLLFGFMPSGRTFIRGVKRLAPASIVRVGRPGDRGETGKYPESRQSTRVGNSSKAGEFSKTGDSSPTSDTTTDGPSRTGDSTTDGPSRTGDTTTDGPLVAEVSIENLRTFDFGIRQNRGKDIGICSSDLVDIFDSCASGRACGTNILAMSGGLDSRCVAASLASRRIDLQGITFLDHFGTAAADIEVAREIAGSLGIPWRLFEPGRASGGDVLRLLRAKNGDNFLGMAFSVPLFDMLRGAYGDRITYFTGEGGGQTLPGYRPRVRLDGVGELADYLIDEICVLTPRQISEIMGVSEGEIRDSVASILDSYPETEMADRFTHFMTCERNMQWTFDAEDRNRSWFWTVSPFQSQIFFEYVMNCPDEMKSDDALCRDFCCASPPKWRR